MTSKTRTIRHTSPPIRILVFLIFASPFGISADEAVESFLALGPIPVKSWAATESETHQKDALRVLAETLNGGKLPSAGATQTLLGADYAWEVRQTAAAIGHPEGEPNLTVLSLNMETGRYAKGTLVFTWPGDIHLFQDMSPVKRSKHEDGKHHFEVTATNGSHHLLAFVSGENGDFSCDWQVEESARVQFHLEPQERVSATRLYHTQTVTQLHLSPDGKWLAVGERGWDAASESWLNQFEIRNFKNGEVRQSWLKETPGNFKWRPDSRAFAFQKDQSIWVQHLEDGKLQKVLSGMKTAAIIDWHPDGESLWINLEKEGGKDAEGVKRYRALEDRWRGWRTIQQIGRLDLASGLIQVFTDEPFGADFADLDENGDRLLYTSSPPDYAQPPHQRTVLKELKVESGEITTLGEFLTFNAIEHFKDGYLVSAGPSAFNGAGNALPGKATANDYDTQLYFWDGTAEGVTCFTKFFDPSVASFEVLSKEEILLLVIENDERTLHTYDPDREVFRKLTTDVDVVERYQVAKGRKPTIVYSGTSATVPQKVYAMKLGDRPEEIHDPSDGAYGQTFFGNVHPWNFTNAAGFEIVGRYYTPPGFSTENRYPLIVYYYGGTVPVNRQFTGRYPFNLWAAHGYVVYVLQPSGTIGMGQRFSSLHVNAWGQKTAEDIVAGTGQFIKAHAFIDENKVGCIGASYGGFMTMYLTTKTNAFGAAISHAGISDLSGYWGEGWWGYAYSGVASRGSFPWNNPELYTESSPLFHADQISTPLLLLHGDADTNVPPGQSHNMYTALKLLDKEVEFITFAGEDHHILNPKLRLVWWDTILAWFDKQLKKQPEWWNALYPDPK